MDEATLARLRRWGGDGFVREMIELFLADTPVRLAALRTSLAVGDRAAVGAAAHGLRNSCGNLGAAAAALLCEQAELRATDTPLDDVSLLVDRLAVELEDVWRALDRQRRALPVAS